MTDFYKGTPLKVAAFFTVQVTFFPLAAWNCKTTTKRTKFFSKFLDIFRGEANGSRPFWDLRQGFRCCSPAWSASSGRISYCSGLLTSTICLWWSPLICFMTPPMDKAQHSPCFFYPVLVPMLAARARPSLRLSKIASLQVALGPSSWTKTTSPFWITCLLDPVVQWKWHKKVKVLVSPPTPKTL